MTSGQTRFPVAPSKFKFAQHGKCGTWVSELLPHTAKHRRRHGRRQDGAHQRHQSRPGLHVRHDRQRSPRQGEHRLLAVVWPGEREQRPAGLRRAHAATSAVGGNGQALFTRMWSSGFLPTRYNGVALRGIGDPVLYLQNPARRRPAAIAARCSTRSSSSISAASSGSAIRKRRPASPSTKWPSACRPACRS